MNRRFSTGIIGSALFAGGLLFGAGGAQAQCVGEVSAEAHARPTYCTQLLHGNPYAVRIENVGLTSGGYRSTRVTRVSRVPGQTTNYDCDYDGVGVNVTLYTTTDAEEHPLDQLAGCGQSIDIPSTSGPIQGSTCQVTVTCDDSSLPDQPQWSEPDSDEAGGDEEISEGGDEEISDSDDEEISDSDDEDEVSDGDGADDVDDEEADDEEADDEWEE